MIRESKPVGTWVKCPACKGTGLPYYNFSREAVSPCPCQGRGVCWVEYDERIKRWCHADDKAPKDIPAPDSVPDRPEER